MTTANTSQLPTKTEAIIAAHDHYMSPNYGRYPIALTQGKGVDLWDAEGKKYLDLFAGFGGPIIGHCHPAIVEAARSQAEKLWHVGNLFHTEPQLDLAKHLHEKSFGGLSFFCHSGADANEAALKLTRIYGRMHPGPKGPRYKVITTHNSFHGRSFGAMMLTAQERVHAGFDPVLEGFEYVPFNNLDAIEDAIDDDTIAIFAEPIQGEGGVNVPDDDYWPTLRSLCDKHDLLLICDEVWTGCGRTGKWFAHQHWNIEPDAMTLAKGLGGGLAVGACVIHPRVANCFDWKQQGGVVHATTLGGNCVSMAVAAAVFKTIEEENLLEHATAMGQLITDRMSQFKAKHDFVTDVRGHGLFIGIELAPSEQTWFETGKDIAAAALQLDPGLVINATQNNILRIAPAMIITEAELTAGLDALEELLLTKPAT